jgi:hypothetical protein
MPLRNLVASPRLAAITFPLSGVDSAGCDLRGLELARQLQRVETDIDLLFVVIKVRR